MIPIILFNLFNLVDGVLTWKYCGLKNGHEYNKIARWLLKFKGGIPYWIYKAGFGLACTLLTNIVYPWAIAGVFALIVIRNILKIKKVV